MRRELRQGFDPDAKTRTVETEPPGSPPAPDVRPGGDLEAGTRVDKFTIIRRIGAGGMGVVYEATDEVLGRRVALKLVDREATEPRAQRVLREARSVASLTHPNVVAVYEVAVGAHGPFIAMEYVDGCTLREWLAAAHRSQGEILEVFRDVGEGLAAAHAAGLVHCDVKPENILVGSDRTRVADFGIARVATADGEGGDEPLPGTPRYMAPEQRRGTADARSDQYSYCLTLLEALGGTLPEPDAPEHAYVAATRSLPAWLATVLSRGLARDPARRHADMRAVLAALRRDPGRRRRARVAAVAALAATGIVGAWITSAVQDAGAPPACDGLDAPMREVWSADRRRELEAAFAASPRPYARDLVGRLVAALDAHAAAWIEARVAACRATARGEQSELLLDRRMRCLDRRLDRTRQLVLSLAQAEPGVLDHAADAVASTTGADLCDDLEALAAEVPPPDDPIARRRVDALARTLAEVEALQDTNRIAEAHDRLEAIGAEVRALAYPPLLADWLWRRGSVALARKEDDLAESLMRELTTVAATGKRDRLTARAWTILMHIYGDRKQRIDDALALLPAAESAIARSGEPVLRADLYHSLAMIRRKQGDVKEAERLYREGLAITEQHLGPRATQVSSMLNALGVLLHKTGRRAEAETVLRRALEIREAHYGPGHPRVAGIHQNLGNLAKDEGRLDDARAAYQRALDGFRASLGPQHPAVAFNLQNLAGVELVAGDASAAVVGYEQALAILRARLPAEHPDVLELLGDLGLARVRAGDPTGGLADCTRARDGFARLELKTLPRQLALSCVGQALHALRRGREAVPVLDEALALATAISAPALVVADTRAHLEAARRAGSR